MMRIANIICLVAGLIIGFTCPDFLRHPHPQAAAAPAMAQSPDAIKARSIDVETYYQVKMDSLAQTNGKLGRQVTTAKSSLQQAKSDNLLLKELVDTLIAQTSRTTDTSIRLAACDSMETAVQDLITQSDQKDSLYEGLAYTLQEQLVNKDNSIGLQQQSYNALKLSFDNSLAQQDLLTSQSAYFEKQLKKMKVKNKLLSTGLCVLSGIAAYAIVRH
jgi:hypothetical protein